MFYDLTAGGFFLVGTICRFKCDLGRKLEGHKSLECSAKGVWNGRFPDCVLTPCNKS